MIGKSTKLSNYVYVAGFLIICLFTILFGRSVMQRQQTILSFGVDTHVQQHDKVQKDPAEAAQETNSKYVEGMVNRGILKNQQPKVDKKDFTDGLNMAKFLSGVVSHRLDRECKATFFKDPADNSRYMLENVRKSSVTKEQQAFLSGSFFQGRRKDQVVLVNAHSSNHHREFKRSLSKVKTHLQDRYKFVIYDLGLQNAELKDIKEECKFCEIRRFPFGDFPPHVGKLMTYAWKPLIIHTMLQEFDYVVWMDTSARFKTSDLSGILSHAKKNSIATYHASHKATCYTHPSTFFFFHEDPCLYSKATLIEASFIVLHSSDYTRQVLSYSWSACALERSCIAPKGTSPYGCVRTRAPDYCGCHRFDQCALSLILYRLKSITPVPTSHPWGYDRPVVDIVRGYN